MTHIMYMTTTTPAFPAVNLQYAAVLHLNHASVTIIVTVATHLIVAVTTTMTKKTAVPLLKRHFTSMVTSLRILSLKETSPLVSRSRKALNLMLKWNNSINGTLVLKTRMQSTVPVRITATKLKRLTSRKGPTCTL